MSNDLLENLNTGVLIQTPPEAIALILQLRELVSKLEALNAALEKRIVELETRVNLMSTNSYKPSSSNSPFISRVDFSRPSKLRQNRRWYDRLSLYSAATYFVMPCACSCKSASQSESTPYYKQQVVELPAIYLIFAKLNLKISKKAQMCIAVLMSYLMLFLSESILSEVIVRI